MSSRQNADIYYMVGTATVPSVSPNAGLVATFKLPRAWAILGLQLSTTIGECVLAIYTDATSWTPDPNGVSSNVVLSNLSGYRLSQVTFSSRDGIKMTAEQSLSLYSFNTGGTVGYSILVYAYFIEQ